MITKLKNQILLEHIKAKNGVLFSTFSKHHTYQDKVRLSLNYKKHIVRLTYELFKKKLNLWVLLPSLLHSKQ